jgi:predicted transcriptional regulator
MQVDFTPEQEQKLSQAALLNGTVAEELVKEIALGFLSQEAEFSRGVEEGIADADAGRFVDPKEVWASVEKLFRQ